TGSCNGSGQPQCSEGLIRIGTATETSEAQLPKYIIIDRCYIHGHDGQPAKRGIALNSMYSAVIDSYVSNWKWDQNDSQAINFYNTPGPIKIVNNYLEAAGENMLVGGTDPPFTGVIP